MFSLATWLIVEGAMGLVRVVAGLVSPTMPPPPTPPVIIECAEGTAYDPVSMACEPAE